MTMQQHLEGDHHPEAQDPRIEKIFEARTRLQLLLMQRWSGGDDEKALEWSQMYRRAFREVFPSHNEPGEKKFLVLTKMQEYVSGDSATSERVVEEVQSMLDQYLREHPEVKDDKTN